MKKNSEFLKEYNLVFTGTLKREDFCRVDFDINKEKINYDNCISLFELISSFNKLYVMFKKEYDELEKINFGNKITYCDFANYLFDGENYRCLLLYINEPTITKHPDTLLYLREIDGEIKPFVTNNRNIFDKKYYRDNIELDNEISKKYLDLFEKYSVLFDTYNLLKNNCLYGDGTFGIYSSIDNYKSNILNGLKNIKISFGASYFNCEYFFNISYNLGEDFGIDYDNCSYIENDEEKSVFENEYDTILQKTFINKKYLKEKK